VYDKHINGALALADVLGIFGREGLDLATLWDPPAYSQPAAYAFRMFRNYDGAGGRFGETSARASNADSERVAAFAATRSEGRVTLMLINKTSETLTCALGLVNYAAASVVRVYRYSAANTSQIVRDADLTVASSMSITLPASSINLIVFASAGRPSDFDGDGDVDASDLDHLLQCGSGPVVAKADVLCSNADLDHDGDVDQIDFAQFQRCYSGTDVMSSATCR
jgi:hypothetical protein